MNSAEKGREGEALAARHYQSQGYTIVACNFKVRSGEIDVIAQRGNLLVFAEVKTRSNTRFAQPKEWVHTAKQQRFIVAAKHFLQQNPQWAEHYMRFDVIEVLLDAMGHASLHQIENAFTL